MFSNRYSIASDLSNPVKNRFFPPGFSTKFSASISSLKVAWRKDLKLDDAIQADKHYKLCARVVREMLNEPGQVIPLRYLEKRRERLRLSLKIQTFIDRNPGLFETYYDKIKPKSQPVVFLRPSGRLEKFLEFEKRRDFGFPNDFMVSIVEKYGEYFRVVGDPAEGNSFLELVSWNPEFAKSVIELRAEEEERLTGIGVRPNFNVRLPSGFVLKKEMREWVRDWLEMEYTSPYDNVSHLDQASPAMEKRTVGLFHELLSLSLLKRMPVPTMGKFSEEFRFSNAFASAFTRHSGIFYLSLKGGIKTAVLREAYRGNQLIDRDPLLAIKESFVDLLAEGHREKAEAMRLSREAVEKELKIMTDDDFCELDEKQCDDQ
ncbi:unnamed protein product [Rhodiola kirilowii]